MSFVFVRFDWTTDGTENKRVPNGDFSPRVNNGFGTKNTDRLQKRCKLGGHNVVNNM